MDGALVDTERLWFLAEQAAVARFGGALPASAEALLTGLDTDALVERLRAGYAADATPAAPRAAIAAGLTWLGVAADPGQRGALRRHTPHVVASLDEVRGWLSLDGAPASPPPP